MIPFQPYQVPSMNETLAVDPKVEALFPNIRNAIDLLRSPLFHDFIALVAAFQTPDKADDKAAFAQLLTDAGMPEMAGMVEPLYDLVMAIIASVNGGKPKEPESEEIRLMAVSPEGIFGSKKTRFHPCIRIRAARQYAKEAGISIAAAVKKLRGITDEQIDGFAVEAGVNVGAIGDGKILQWIIDHGPEIMAIIKLIIAALMAM